MNKKTTNTVNKEDERRNSLAQLAYEYEVLCNELFHLKEYISLLEFDPSYRNSSNSYDTFIKENDLSLKSLDIKKENGSTSRSEVSNTALRVRKRQLRQSGNEQPQAKDTYWFDDIKPLVDKKYDALSTEIDVVDKDNKINTKPTVLKAVKENETTSSSKKKSESEKQKNTNETQVPFKPETHLHNSTRKHKIRNHDVVDKNSNNETIKQKVAFTASQNNKLGSEELKLMKKEEKPKTARVNIEKNENEDGNDEDSDDYYFTTSSDESDTPFTKRKKRNLTIPTIKLVVHPPKQTITNPGHVVKSEYGGVSNFLSSFRSMDEDMTNEEFEDYISEQRKVLSQLRKGLESGALKYDEETDSIQPITTKDTKVAQVNKTHAISYLYKEQNVQVFQDTLVKHGVQWSKLFQNNKRSRILRARKVSQMIEQHFRHIAGAEERKIKEEEKHRKLLARSAMQAVKKRWNMAERAYKVLKKDEEQELKRIQGKEHLSKVLKQSSELLDAQLRNITSRDSKGDLNSSEMEQSSEDDLSNEDDVTSSSEEESDGQTDFSEKKEVDKDLSVEQLKEKYKFINEVSNAETLETLVPEIASGNDESSPESSYANTASKDDGLKALFDSISTDDEDADINESFTVSSDENVNFSASDELNITSSEEEEEDANESGDNNNPEIDEKHSSTEFDKPSTTETKTFEPEKTIPTTVVDVPTPSLLRGTLRIYQKQGLNWLASLYNNNTNGILADEMGLGKTIQTISLLSYLACEKQNWGPHLVVVPTSVLLNWEMEFKKFAPGFKVLTYYGNPQQRKEKRKGWNKQDSFNVCIVSYQLVVQDQHSFKRKKWQYMILDEAHNIKNFRSTRWQALLNFNTQRRLLLTGTPLQNNIGELWSLLYFLMPQTVTNGNGVSGFADLDAFQQWFGKPVNQIIESGQAVEEDSETKDTVEKLHKVLRPYLLRRLKADVEKQMPGKYEHIVYCKLSKRQRFLYDDFMSRAQTKATLASGNFMSIVNCLMQLRKVCNHPDLFEVRPIMSSFSIDNSAVSTYNDTQRYVHNLLHANDYKENVDLQTLNFVFTKNDEYLSSNNSKTISTSKCIKEFVDEVDKLRSNIDLEQRKNSDNFDFTLEFFKNLGIRKIQELVNSIEHRKYLNNLRCDKSPVYGKNLINLLVVKDDRLEDVSFSAELIKPLQTRIISSRDMIQNFAVITPNVVTLDIRPISLGLDNGSSIAEQNRAVVINKLHNTTNPFHQLQTKLTLAFPDKSLLQYDCGKLQRLATLLHELKDNGHRALIFTQMTKVLDILEQFLNYHGYLYMRLDGATKIEDRQILTERFNSDPRVTVFILSSRSGGLGINLTGADSVIFYDSDWNPAMDKQCQDRCHRIGQTRDVHIYRFVSEHTIESNILQKANQKRHLDNLVIQQGDFTTDYLTKLSVKDILRNDDSDDSAPENDKPLLFNTLGSGVKGSQKLESLLAHAEDEEDVKAANLAMKEIEVDNEDFDENADQNSKDEPGPDSELVLYEGTKHVEEYMLRFIANGYYY
ncbi:hypothetical protein TPHA_0D02260 [Tetrapisispora phaffii CBS 4417]|uniref:Helicase SWR1 n=1 Tax=Tetrapisispora phaffii (strain ATCC 24235 / CBS 4417 / NBRC 1672 / NRRL Y-8282 / UCD 70-5) TaxID=1071381 RepID=G8BSP3_TETPH|nr:hypothetical protein TPHA_0D02260 [Tetrapisispora phaffii CBS 4417]CCE62864.1 hypothetical protein TPHA_0D02260 [Tetrapisispora phaffii CBS 4417]